MSKPKRTPTIIQAINHPSLFGSLPAFEKLETWAGWLVWLKAVFALPMTGCRFGDLSPMHRQRAGANYCTERGLYNRRQAWREVLHIGVNGRLGGLLRLL
jgi:hypothetical protein